MRVRGHPRPVLIVHIFDALSEEALVGLECGLCFLGLVILSRPLVFEPLPAHLDAHLVIFDQLLMPTLTLLPGNSTHLSFDIEFRLRASFYELLELLMQHPLL